MKYYLKILSVPLLFLVLYASLTIVWQFFDFPSVERLTEIVGIWFEKYGIPVLLVGSFLEGILLIGSYFPGVFVIFLGVLVADSPIEAGFAVAICTIGLLVAHITNYFLGKYGWYKLLVKFGMKEAVEQSKIKLEKRGPLAIPLSYWLPSIGALTNTAAGIIQMPFKKFIAYSFVSSVVWYSLVGLIVYHMGNEALEIAGGGSGNLIVFIIIALWILGIIFFDYRERNSNSSSNIVH